MPVNAGPLRDHSLARFAAGALFILGASTATGEDALAGLWLTEGGKSVVEVTRDVTSGEYAGRIVWLAEPLFAEADDQPDRIGQPKRDLNNPDPKRREDPIIGLTILKGFTKRGERWEGGTVYDPENGKTYQCTLRLKGQGRLAVRGYIGVPAFGRSTMWTRVPASDAAKYRGGDAPEPAEADI